jgi:hypothetical protein
MKELLWESYPDNAIGALVKGYVKQGRVTQILDQSLTWHWEKNKKEGRW